MYIQCLLPRVIEGQRYAMANLQPRALKAYRFSHQKILHQNHACEITQAHALAKDPLQVLVVCDPLAPSRRARHFLRSNHSGTLVSSATQVIQGRDTIQKDFAYEPVQCDPHTA